MTTIAERITISSPAQLAASIPSLIGFAPVDSLVVVLVRGANVVVTMRMDLDQCWSEISAGVLATTERVGADSALLIVCAERREGLPFLAEIQRLESDLGAQGVSVPDALVIDGGRWWSYGCNGGCCLEAGELVDPDMDRVGGGTVLGRREDVAGGYLRRADKAPSMRAVRRATEALASEPRVRAERAWTVLQDLAATPGLAGPSSDDQRALIQLSCLDVRCRDYLLGSICAADDPAPLVTAFVDAALRSHDETLPRMAGAAAALLLATQSSTVPASCLIELAGDDSLARLIEQSIHQAVRPCEYSALIAGSLPQTMAALSEAGDVQ